MIGREQQAEIGSAASPILRSNVDPAWQACCESLVHAKFSEISTLTSLRKRWSQTVDKEDEDHHWRWRICSNSSDGTVIYRQRYVGSFTQSLRLQSFPFDRQAFHIQLVAIRYRPNEVVFVPDENWIRDGLQQAAGISPSITLPDWTVEKWDAKARVYALKPGMQYSGYVFEFTASRNVEHYLLKVILPLILIVMMSWAVFWIDPNTSNSQISIAVTSMLTLIAYRFAVDSQLPRLPYMTRLDIFFLTSTLLVFFSLIEVLVTTILENQKRNRLAITIDRFCRVIFPMIFLLASMSIFVHPRG